MEKTVKDVETRWSEQNMSSEKQNPSKYLNSNTIHHICSVIFSATVWKVTGKSLEAYFIALLKPTLNDQRESYLLHLFKNGIAQITVDKTVNIPQRRFILTLYIVAIPILLFI